MRSSTLCCALLVAAAALSVPAVAQKPAGKPAAPAASPVPASSSAPAVTQAGGPVAPTIAAASWVLVDTLSGQTLGASNPDERRDPASITKLMTAYVAFGALRAKTITPS